MPQIKERIDVLGYKVQFDNKEQYDLFMDYVRQTFVENSWAGSENASLEKIYVKSSDPGKFKVHISNEHGNLGLLSKFMETTGMEMTGTGSQWNAKAHMGPDYGQEPNPGALHLDRRGDATIPPQIMQKMENYKQMHPRQATENRQQRQTSPSGRTPAFENPISSHSQSSLPSKFTEFPHTASKQSQKPSKGQNPTKATDNRVQTIKQTLSQYESHLHQKLLNEGVIKNLTAPVDPKAFNKALLEPKQLKLLNRYEAISNAHSKIKGKPSLNSNDFATIKTAVKTCLDNKPEWSERSFLQKFTDVLTLGFKSLYRSLVSKETEYEKTLNESLPTFKK